MSNTHLLLEQVKKVPQQIFEWARRSRLLTMLVQVERLRRHARTWRCSYVVALMTIFASIGGATAMSVGSFAESLLPQQAEMDLFTRWKQLRTEETNSTVLPWLCDNTVWDYTTGIIQTGVVLYLVTRGNTKRKRRGSVFKRNGRQTGGSFERARKRH